jgi:cobyrinic acid a,c-diamide synthase
LSIGGGAACPALLVSAPASGQGKTLVTAALARAHRAAGRRVRVFKCGPDFLDPMVLAVASDGPVCQLDLWMGGADDCAARLHEAACDADLILVEGVMGQFDGAPSAADLAARFGLPILAVIDASAMAGTFGALVHGLATFRQDIHLAAVLANRVGSARHADMLRDSLRDNIHWLGALPRDAELALPERHLGLVQADEIADLDTRLSAAADRLGDVARWLPPVVQFPAPVDERPARVLAGCRIAIARDEAFAFIYPANLALLEQLRASGVLFSAPRRALARMRCRVVAGRLSGIAHAHTLRQPRDQGRPASTPSNGKAAAG